MQVLRVLTLIVMSLGAFSAVTVAKASEPGTSGGLFINLTTDDTWSAAKAIYFAHNKALKNGHRPVAIWLNVRAVYLAEKKRASNVPGVMRDQNLSIQDMLTAFMQDGGQVILCAACSQAAGLTEADYIDGVQMGRWDLVQSLLFDPNVKTLAW